MSSEKQKNKIEQLSAQMKNDWDRRIQSDYRFWMSDGHSSDGTMWESGERDFAIISKDIANKEDLTLLELGCGVGRLLRAGLGQFKKVIGVDVSEEAINKAKSLLNEFSNLQLIVGNGIDLKEVESKSIDVLISFAAITSVPTEIIAHYFFEINRVIKDDGVVRLQVYLGKEQIVNEQDTLHLRCFDRDNFTKAMEGAGFSIQWEEELILPFQVSFKEVGIEAVVVSLKKISEPALSVDEISKQLLSNNETVNQDQALGIGDLEYWMSLNYVDQLVNQGKLAKARGMLDFATLNSQITTIDVGDLLTRIIDKLEAKESEQNSAGILDIVPEGMLFQTNLDFLAKKFPEVSSQLVDNKDIDLSDLQISETHEGRVISLGGQCLDHQTKPIKAAEKWAKNILAEKKIGKAQHIIVYGLGSGYHIEVLQRLTDKKISVIEPRIDVLLMAVKARDLTECFSCLQQLVVGENLSIDRGVFEGDSELIIRPQSQVISIDQCTKIKSDFYGARGISALNPSIGVLGPLQGGTLPIMGYTYHSLCQLKQRGRTFDMSGYASGYHLMEEYVQNDVRKAVVQGNYIEMLSQLILESTNEKPIDILICMAQAPISGRALTELRKKGVITVLWFVEDYLRFTYWQSSAQYYDFIFTIQKGDCIEAIKQAGAGSVHYLPLACDPAIHAPLTLSDEEKERWGSPLSFVGAGYHNRQQTFSTFANMPLKLWGTEWPECRPFDKLVQEKGRRIQPVEYVKIFNASTININLHSSAEKEGVDPTGDFVNPRTFELASAGAFQLVDDRQLLPEMFKPGEEIATFSNGIELKEKIDYYLSHPEERERIATNSRRRVLEEHTYNHRIKEMLSVIYSSKFEHIKRRLDGSPWSKMLSRAEKHPELHQRCKIAFDRGEEPNLDGLVSDIIAGAGALTETEQKLLFLFHIRKQIIRMTREETSESKDKE